MEEHSPLVTIIIPNYNNGCFLEQCISSVVLQEYKNIECIIIDDGSTDNSLEIIRTLTIKYPFIKYFNSPHKGPAHARNIGLKNAKGDFIQFLDADDLLQPLKIFNQVSLFNLKHNVEIVYSDIKIFYENKLNSLYDEKIKRPNSSGCGSNMITEFLKSTIYPSSSLIKASVIRRIGFLDENLIQSEDWAYYIMASLNEIVFEYLPSKENSYTLIRKHFDNNTRNFWRLQKYGILMRQSISRYLIEEKHIEINRYLINAAGEDLIIESLKRYQLNRLEGIKYFFRTFFVTKKVRHFIYAIFSIFFSYNLVNKMTKFSFRNIFARNREN